MTVVLANIFTPSSTNLIFVASISAISAFAFGILLKGAALAKHKKKILSLEDEMLANHARILELEKEAAELRDENTKLRNTGSAPKVELKAS